MDLQKTLDKAWELKKNGELKDALALYSEAFDFLTSQASDQAKKDLLISPISNKITPDIFDISKKYLKSDTVTCTISNNMATIFAELGDIESARKFFEQSIELTPDGTDYKDPKIGLEELKK